MIENKDGYRVFYTRGELITREEHLQILYRLTWFETPSDVNREVNNGRGPVDFKVSRGSADRTVIEFKLASNSQPSDAPRALKVITFFTAEQQEHVERILRELKLVGHRDIVLIDPRNDNKPSASAA